MAIQRADAVVSWAQLLLAEAGRRNQSPGAEAGELRAAEERLAQAKVRFHTFNLDNVRQQADEAFVKGARVKDALRKKVSPQ